MRRNINHEIEENNAGGYGQGRSPSAQRKLDARTLTFKAVLWAMFWEAVLSFLMFGMFKSDASLSNETEPYKNHVWATMTSEQWELEKSNLIKLGNDPVFLQSIKP